MRHRSTTFTTIRFITFTVSHIHTVREPSTHCQSQEFGIAANVYHLQSKVILALVVKANEIFNHAVQVNWSCKMCYNFAIRKFASTNK